MKAYWGREGKNSTHSLPRHWMVVNSRRHGPTVDLRTQLRYQLNWRLLGSRSRLDISGEEKSTVPFSEFKTLISLSVA